MIQANWPSMQKGEKVKRIDKTHKTQILFETDNRTMFMVLALFVLINIWSSKDMHRASSELYTVYAIDCYTKNMWGVAWDGQRHGESQLHTTRTPCDTTELCICPVAQMSLSDLRATEFIWATVSSKLPAPPGICAYVQAGFLEGFVSIERWRLHSKVELQQTSVWTQGVWFSKQLSNNTHLNSFTWQL
jgi:hypothetical protein